MVTTKPIKVDEEVKKTLDNKKIHPRETYNDILRRILNLNNKERKDEDTTVNLNNNEGKDENTTDM